MSYGLFDFAPDNKDYPVERDTKWYTAPTSDTSLQFPNEIIHMSRITGVECDNGVCLFGKETKHLVYERYNKPLYDKLNAMSFWKNPSDYVPEQNINKYHECMLPSIQGRYPTKISCNSNWHDAPRDICTITYSGHLTDGPISLNVPRAYFDDLTRR